MMRSNLSSRLREKRRKARLARAAFVLCAILLFVGIIAVISGLQFATIREVVVEGNQAVPTEEIVAIAKENLAGRYAKLFSRANVLLYPKNEIRSELLGGFARFSNVSIERDDWRRLAVRVAERRPSGLWCRGESCYFLDETGLVFAPAPDYSGNVYVKFSGVIEGDPVGVPYMQPAEFESARRFLKDLEALGIEGRTFSIGQSEDVRIGASDGSEIVWNKEQTYEALLLKLQAGLPEIKSAVKKAGSPLRLIDLRFDSQIVYKLQE